MMTFRTLLQRGSRGVEAFVWRVGGRVLSASWRQTGDMLPSRLQLAQNARPRLAASRTPIGAAALSGRTELQHF